MTEVQIPKHKEMLNAKLHNFFQQEYDCDCVVVAGKEGVRIPAHTLVLRAVSDYFIAMFDGSFKEAQTKEIILEDFDGDVVRQIIEFCYTGSITFTRANSLSVIELASLLQLSELFKAAMSQHIKQIKVEDCLETLRFVEKYEDQDGLRHVQRFITENFCYFLEQPTFLELEYEELKEYLQSDDLSVANEQSLFEATMAWINHKQEERQKHRIDLLKCIRFPMIPTPILKSRIAPVCDDSDLLKMLSEAYLWQLDRELSSLDFTKYTTPREGYYNLYRFSFFAESRYNSEHSNDSDCY